MSEIPMTQYEIPVTQERTPRTFHMEVSFDGTAYHGWQRQSNGITVQEIADRLNLNRSYLSTLFKERQGIAPQQDLLKVRMERAAELMTLYRERPSVACASVGYSDLYNFSKVFKVYFGMSPRNYQLQHQIFEEN